MEKQYIPEIDPEQPDDAVEPPDEQMNRYLAFRKVRHVRDEVCTNREGKKLLTRIMRRLKD